MKELDIAGTKKIKISSQKYHELYLKLYIHKRNKNLLCTSYIMF